MGDWLKNHVFIAAWISPTIALVGLILKKSDPINPVNWSKIMIYVGFLTALAIVVTPGLTADAMSMAKYLIPACLGYMIIESMWHRR